MQARDEHIMSDIEFPIFVEQRFLDIFLNYVCFLRSIEMFLFFLEDIVQLIYLIDDCDALSAIGELSWFYYPYILCSFFGG